MLSDGNRRRMYDAHGHAAFEHGMGGMGGGPGGPDMGDIFGDIFGNILVVPVVVVDVRRGVVPISATCWSWTWKKRWPASSAASRFRP